MEKKEKILSICMPTYNRPECVAKSLAHYERVIREGGLGEKVEICISDNSTNGETEGVVGGFAKKLCIKYSRNKENLGYDRNAVLAMSLADGKFSQLVGDELFYFGESLASAVGMLENGGVDALIFDDDGLFHKGGAQFKAEIDGKRLWEKALSHEWVKKRSITHIDYVVIRNSDFRNYLRHVGNRLDEFYGLTFVQLSFYMFALKRAARAGVVGRVNEQAADNAPKKAGVYFPSDDARVIYRKYFFEFKKCLECGIISEKEYEKFKKNFFFSAWGHLLRIRTHMYPRIYRSEEKETLRHIVLVEGEYSGTMRMALAALRRLLFIEEVPYHLLYVAFDLMRTHVLGKPRVSALALYEKCLDGQEGSTGGKLYKTDF